MRIPLEGFRRLIQAPDVYKRQLKYIVSYASTYQAPEDFTAFISSPVEPVFWHFLFLFVTCLLYTSQQRVRRYDGGVQHWRPDDC